MKTAWLVDDDASIRFVLEKALTRAGFEVESMPIAPIYYYMQARLVRPTVGGFAKNNVEGRIYSKDLYTPDTIALA